MNKFSRWKKLNILLFMNVTEVAEYVVPFFRIQNICFLKTFQCEVKVGCKTNKGASVFTTEIVKVCISGE